MFHIAVLSFVLGYIAILLIGSHDCFAGTRVERLHYLLTDGVCNLAEFAIDKVCGRKGLQFLEATEASCCHGSNPIGQLIFGLLFAGSYLAVHSGIFPLLDNTEISNWHKYSGAVVASTVLFFFYLVCSTDPGRITSANVAAHLALYPPDGVIFPQPPHLCATCQHLKPARSKHCNATQGCVARFDHWCIWINNAVGLYNTRWFLAFLLMTGVACCYGSVLGVQAIAADMRYQGVWDKEWREPRTGKIVKLQGQWVLVGQFVLSRYPVAGGVAAFLGAATLIVVGFTGAQVHRIVVGVTTNESWKAKDVGATAAQRGVFNRGWRRNFSEVLFPHTHLANAVLLQEEDRKND